MWIVGKIRLAASVSDGKSAGGLTDEDLPTLFAMADQASLAAQGRTVRLTRTQLVLAVLSALVAGLAVGVGSGKHWVDGAAVALFVASFIPAFPLRAGATQRRWYDGRAAAESTRSLAWKYAMRAAPFEDDDDIFSEEEFDARLTIILSQVPELEGSVADASTYTMNSVTDSMRALREAPLDSRKNAYITDRIDSQLAYYVAKARRAEQLGKLASRAVWTIGLAGVSVGLARTLWRFPVDLLGVSAAAIAAIVAFGQLRQYWPVMAAYQLTAAELLEVRKLADLTVCGQEWSQFVAHAEYAMSREHTTWQARRP
jgi:hypothetical protein